MKIVVLVAGVHDPKWPVTPDAVLAGASDHRIMSPFDEAALEMALRVRDAQPATSIAVRVAGGEASAKIARAVAALRISDLAAFSCQHPWDQAAMARALAPLCQGADMVLIGREFGDFDDGLVPAMLAGIVGWPFFGRAQTIDAGAGVQLMREAGSHVESLTLSGPLVASVTNDRRTRLRKPLMKNVMEARQAEIGMLPAEVPPSPGLSLAGLLPCVNSRAGTDCAMLDGPPHVQAQALADILWEGRA